MLAGTVSIRCMHVFTGPGRLTFKATAYMCGKLILAIGRKHYFFSMIASSWAEWVSSCYNSWPSLESELRNQDRSYHVFHSLAYRSHTVSSTTSSLSSVTFSVRTSLTSCIVNRNLTVILALYSLFFFFLIDFWLHVSSSGKADV